MRNETAPMQENLPTHARMPGSVEVPAFDPNWDGLWLEAGVEWPLGLLLTPPVMARCAGWRAFQSLMFLSLYWEVHSRSLNLDLECHLSWHLKVLRPDATTTGTDAEQKSCAYAVGRRAACWRCEECGE